MGDKFMAPQVDTTDSKRVVLDVYDAFRSGDVDKALAAFAPDVVLHEPGSLPYGGTHTGVQEVMGVFGQVAQIVDPATIEIKHLIGEGSDVVAFLRPTFLLRDGERLEVPFCEHWKIQDGKVVELWPYYFDTAALQGGLETPPELETLWSDHLGAEFATKDVEATLATMVEDASVTIVPINAGGRGKAELRAFYRDKFIPSWPEDLIIQPLSRVTGRDHIVDEVRIIFTHTQEMHGFLPGVAPTHHKVEVDIVVVVQFRDGLIASERIYWDHASVLRQVGLLEPATAG
jgi:carboxymethylenebutenolidase